MWTNWTRDINPNPGNGTETIPSNVLIFNLSPATSTRIPATGLKPHNRPSLWLPLEATSTRIPATGLKLVVLPVALQPSYATSTRIPATGLKQTI